MIHHVHYISTHCSRTQISVLLWNRSILYLYRYVYLSPHLVILVKVTKIHVELLSPASFTWMTLMPLHASCHCRLCCHISKKRRIGVVHTCMHTWPPPGLLRGNGENQRGTFNDQRMNKGGVGRLKHLIIIIICIIPFHSFFSFFLLEVLKVYIFISLHCRIFSKISAWAITHSPVYM